MMHVSDGSARQMLKVRMRRDDQDLDERSVVVSGGEEKEAGLGAGESHLLDKAFLSCRRRSDDMTVLGLFCSVLFPLACLACLKRCMQVRACWWVGKLNAMNAVRRAAEDVDYYDINFRL